MNNLKIVVLGKGGQLASEFESIMNKNLMWIFLSHSDLDITESNSVLNYFTNNPCNIIINCASYNNVDLAEIEAEKAFKVNYQGIINLLKACIKINAKLIHYSTDYVFDGQNKFPYDELQLPNPLGVYAKSKLEGELEITNSLVKSIIIRTSWLYSNHGNNFVKRMLQLALNEDEIFVVDDQIGSPTNANDLALFTISLLGESSYNWTSGEIFHFSNEGCCSRFEFARKIFKISKQKIKLFPTKTDNLDTHAKRPSYSVLDTLKAKNRFNFSIPKWEDSLKKMISKELILK